MSLIPGLEEVMTLQSVKAPRLLDQLRKKTAGQALRLANRARLCDMDRQVSEIPSRSKRGVMAASTRTGKGRN